MFGLGSDRKVFGIHFQGRFLLAGAHATWPRHPCRLRPAQIRNREIVGARAAGAARHGDDGLMMASIFHYTDAAGLVGILSSKSLFATHYRCLNDFTEAGVISDLIMPILEAEVSDITPKLVERGWLKKEFYDQYGAAGHRTQAEGLYSAIT